MAKEKKESTYTILSKILKLKFYDELKDSGIELENIYRMTNLETGKENYLLVVNNKEIRFVTTYDFVCHFSNFIISNLKYYNIEYNELIKLPINQYTDDVAIEMKYKEIDCFRIKQHELLEKMITLKNAIKNDKSRNSTQIL